MSSRDPIRCAIYTRKSTEEGLDSDFNTLDAQREAAEAFIASQKAEGWVCLPDHYDDGGFTGANMDRPAMQRLLADIRAGKVDAVVVYKVDRLSRSLIDFARIMETFESQHVSFVSVTQQFNTTHSMGRLTLNILLSFAQFEREIISERTRDKIAATRRKGKWAGGHPILGYDIDPANLKLMVNDEEAKRVREIFGLYVEMGTLMGVANELNDRGWRTKQWEKRKGGLRGGSTFNKGKVFSILTNVAYIGLVKYKDEVHDGEHEAIVDRDLWDRVQEILREHGRNGGMQARNRHNALLKGLLFCGPCGRAMGHTFTQKGDRLYRYYTCQAAQKQGWETCPSKALPAEQIEQFAVDRIKALGSDPALRAATLAEARRARQERIDALEGDRVVAQRELKRLGAEIAKAAQEGHEAGDGGAWLAELHAKAEAAEARLRALSRDVARETASLATKAEVDGALGTFDEVWANLTPREQARVVRLLVSRVDYDGERGSVAITFRDVGLAAPAGEEAAA